MKRKIEFVDSGKWYHLETLKKFFKNRLCTFDTNIDVNGEPYDVVKFRKGWNYSVFVVHPKNKRIKYASVESVAEIREIKRGIIDNQIN